MVKGCRRKRDLQKGRLLTRRDPLGGSRVSHPQTILSSVKPGMASVELSSVTEHGLGGAFLPYTEHGLGGVWVVDYSSWNSSIVSGEIDSVLPRLWVSLFLGAGGRI